MDGNGRFINLATWLLAKAVYNEGLGKTYKMKALDAWAKGRKSMAEVLDDQSDLFAALAESFFADALRYENAAQMLAPQHFPGVRTAMSGTVN